MQAPSLVCMHALSCAVGAVETVILLDNCIYWHPCNPRLIIAYAVADTLMFWLRQYHHQAAKGHNAEGSA